jgi:hypothetical protein
MSWRTWKQKVFKRTWEKYLVENAKIPIYVIPLAIVAFLWAYEEEREGARLRSTQR